MYKVIDKKIDSIIDKLRKVIINGKLNITCGWFAMISFIVCMIFPLSMYFFVYQSTSIVKTSLTIIAPLLVNMIIIPMFKIFSFYQEVDEEWLKDKNDTREKKYFKDRQIIWTESILLVVSSLPIVLWYFFVGFSQISHSYPNIAFLILLILSMLVLLILLYYMIAYLSKIVNYIYKVIKTLISKSFKIVKSLVSKLLQTLKN